LMYNKEWKNIENVKIGEYLLSINGPTLVESLDNVKLGHRKMLTFEDDRSFKWSEEHLLWAKYIKEWWWCFNTHTWRKEVENGYVKGLKDNFSLMTGDNGFSFAHINGWVNRKVVEDFSSDWNTETPLYLPITDGSPIIVDGYLVTAGTDEKRFDYNKINWDRDCKGFKGV